MKNIFYIISITLISLLIHSCEIDNYDGPTAAIQGNILDQNGNSLQTDQGSGTMRIKMEELSWASSDSTIAITPTYLNVKQDGSFNNSKIFKGEYRMTPIEGPFFPYDEEGEVIVIDGNVSKNFTVTPYLSLEWVTEPFLNDSNYISASVRFTRNSKEGANQPDLLNALLCISPVQYVGQSNYDSQMSVPISISNGQEGEVINLVTTREVKYSNATYYVRVGISCSDAYKKYNYTDVKTITSGNLN